MPTYDYICTQCTAHFTLRHRYKCINVVCLSCGSSEIKKDLSKPIAHNVKAFTTVDNKAGTQVKQAIHDNQVELKKTRKKISKRVYKK